MADEIDVPRQKKNLRGRQRYRVCGSKKNTEDDKMQIDIYHANRQTLADFRRQQ